MLKTINGGKEPTKGSKYSACIDLYAREDVVIYTGETKMIPLGVCIDDNFFVYEIAGVTVDVNGEIINGGDSSKVNEFLSTHCIKLFPRSSFRAKGLISHTGIIDLDFKDEWQMIVHNPINSNADAINAKVISMQLALGEKGTPENIIEEAISEYVKNEIDSLQFIIKKGDKVAQAMIIEHKTSFFGIETEEERTGGFGSTGER